MDPIRVNQNCVARYRFTLVDENKSPVPLSSLTGLDATLYDVSSDAIINGRDHQSILNTNGGTYGSVNGKGTLLLGITDNPIVGTDEIGTPPGEEETHRLLIEASWAGGARRQAWEVDIYVKNLRRV